MDLNKVMIIGRLTRDPELRTTPNGASVCQLGLATNYVYTNQQSGQKVEQVEYHNVVLWRKLAEIQGTTLGATKYIWAQAIQSPMPLAVDERGRRLFVVSFHIEKEPS